MNPLNKFVRLGTLGIAAAALVISAPLQAEEMPIVPPMGDWIHVPGNFGDINTNEVASGLVPGQTGFYIPQDRRLVQVDTFADPIRRRRMRGIITVHSLDENGAVIDGRTVELPTKGRSRLIVRERANVTFNTTTLEVTQYTYSRNHRGSFRIQGRNPGAGRVTVRANTRSRFNENDATGAPQWTTRVRLRNLEGMPGRIMNATFINGFEQYFTMGYAFGFNRDQLQARPRGNTFAGSGVVRDLNQPGGPVIAPNSRINIRLGNPDRQPYQRYRMRLRQGGPRGAGFLGMARERGYAVPIPTDFVGPIPNEPVNLPGGRVQDVFDYSFGPLYDLDEQRRYIRVPRRRGYSGGGINYRLRLQGGQVNFVSGAGQPPQVAR